MTIHVHLFSRQGLTVLTTTLLLNLPAWAEDPVRQSAQTSGRASAQVAGSAVLGVSALGNATLAISTVPLAVGGSVMTTVGQASTAAAGASLGGSAALPVTDEVITTVPPGVALRQPTTAHPTAR